MMEYNICSVVLWNTTTARRFSSCRCHPSPTPLSKRRRWRLFLLVGQVCGHQDDHRNSPVTPPLRQMKNGPCSSAIPRLYVPLRHLPVQFCSKFLRISHLPAMHEARQVMFSVGGEERTHELLQETPLFQSMNRQGDKRTHMYNHKTKTPRAHTQHKRRNKTS